MTLVIAIYELKKVLLKKKNLKKLALSPKAVTQGDEAL
jgi:hypothetical protein